MAYHKYTTDGFILREYPVGETSSRYSILTKELGLVNAKATGVRKHNSKLRYGLQEYSFAEVSFVRGRHGWRVVGALPQDNAFFVLKPEHVHWQLFGVIVKLIQRLVHGEAPEPFLYEITAELFERMRSPNISHETLAAIEKLAVLRILFVLGYLDAGKDLVRFVRTADFGDETVSDFRSVESTAVEKINESFSHLHL